MTIIRIWQILLTVLFAVNKQHINCSPFCVYYRVIEHLIIHKNANTHNGVASQSITCLLTVICITACEHVCYQIVLPVSHLEEAISSRSGQHVINVAQINTGWLPWQILLLIYQIFGSLETNYLLNCSWSISIITEYQDSTSAVIYKE